MTVSRTLGPGNPGTLALVGSLQPPVRTAYGDLNDQKPKLHVLGEV